MSEYHVEFEELDLHWIVYEVFPDKEVSVEIMRFVNRDQAESYVENVLLQKDSDKNFD
tara:strand:- start:567 stop:740 length:174 start_codon:yes stop_codon:yes gene_type:complete